MKLGRTRSECDVCGEIRLRLDNPQLACGLPVAPCARCAQINKLARYTRMGLHAVKLSRLYVRFFRSFNYDYVRRADPKADRPAWEFIDEAWFPFVRIDLDARVTAVVGANESGKSHMIDALDTAITGTEINRDDFCRFSRLYSAKRGASRNPEFGIEFTLDDSDGDLDELLGLSGRRATLLRLNERSPVLAQPNNDELIDLSDTQLTRLDDRLPTPIRIETELALPNSVTYEELREQAPGALSRRAIRTEFVSAVESAVRAAEDQGSEIQMPSLPVAKLDQESVKKRAEQVGLARKLLIDVAEIDATRLDELSKAVQHEDEGRVSGLQGKMNDLVRRKLNLARWWRQDPDFELRIGAHERDLSLKISDRTETEYSFAERSKGLRYFLSYFIQLLATEREPERSYVLLMDEPDAYLSSAGQQDLLRFLEHFATGRGESSNDQVVYVTHSPFLLDKNAADRIRVIEKGYGDEGTRVVQSAARNRYEPLRSSLGTYVAETAFIGGVNLFVEGISDQVLIAGMSALLDWKGVPKSSILDLNEVTIVAADGAQNLPYLTYLARARDETKPPCAALLDGDEEGKKARVELEGDPLKGRQLLRPEYILDLEEWMRDARPNLSDGVRGVELEDLIPIEVAVEAGRNYATQYLKFSDEDARRLTQEELGKRLTGSNDRLVKALEGVFQEIFDGAGFRKIAFAKAVVAFAQSRREQPQRRHGLKALEDNFEALLTELARILREADLEESRRRLATSLKRIVEGFLDEFDDSTSVPRDRVELTLLEVDATLEADEIGDAIRAHLAQIRRTFEIEVDPAREVADFSSLREELRRLPQVGKVLESGATP